MSKFNSKAIAFLGQIWDVAVRVRAEGGRVTKIHKTNKGADLAFVDVTLTPTAEILPEGVTAEDTRITLHLMAKVLPNAGNWLAISDAEGSDGNRYPALTFSESVRHALIGIVFQDERIAFLASEARRVMAERAKGPQASAPAPQADPTAALLAQLMTLLQRTAPTPAQAPVQDCGGTPSRELPFGS